MTSILEDETVRSYFACECLVGGGTACPSHGCMSCRVLSAMQEPIRKGDKMITLLMAGGDGKTWQGHTQESDKFSWGEFHPFCLRLPQRFQPSSEKKCCDVEKYFDFTADGTNAKLCPAHYEAIRKAIQPPPNKFDDAVKRAFENDVIIEPGKVFYKADSGNQERPMRAIKFRAKRTDRELWVHGHYFVAPLTDENSGTKSESGWFFLSGDGIRNCIEQENVSYVVKINTLGQFTGLLDKNGKEIYEGDILEIVEAHEDGCGCDHCFPYRNGDKLKVVWFDASFGLLPVRYEIKEHFCEQCAGYVGLMSPNHEMPIGFFGKVVGNIHENPELLK